jgi:uncharacterized protein YdeI (YjbR/CyaY-like superfamily)
MKPKFFKTPAAFRAWLEKNHDAADELLVGFYKKGSGKPSIDWPQSVDEALCFGWIDGIRRNIDEESYSIRFTPRRKDSHWSAVNVRKMKELTEAGKMTPAGQAAFDLRREDKTAIHAYENRKEVKLDPALEKQLKANEAAWEYFQKRPAGYRHLALFYVMSAKREETRQRRVEKLIEDSAAGRPIGQLIGPKSAVEPRKAAAKASSKGGRSPRGG